MTRPNQGLSSHAPGGGKMIDPGNEVANYSEGVLLLFLIYPSGFFFFFFVSYNKLDCTLHSSVYLS